MRILNTILIAAALGASALMGCSMNSALSVTNGNVKDVTVRKNVRIGNFDKIDVQTGIRVIFTQGNATGIAQVATTPSAEKYLKITVSDGELSIRYEKTGTHSIKGPTIVKVVSPYLTEVELSSAATLKVAGDLDLRDKLNVDLSSAGKAVFNNVTAKSVNIDLSSSSSAEFATINADKVNVDVSSASKTTISKSVATSLDLEASSAAKIEIGYFNGTNINAEASSAAGISISGIMATKTYAEASSGAKVTLKGKCEYIDKETGSGGRVDTSQLNISDLPRKSTGGRHTPTRQP